ncbi:fibronectin type III domain-containing protein 5 isoform X1 [Anguilla anguilla]|uniref:fibronectin type III domain-containing protein 5 isoform X1 n=1 Tax=Anguilla anguilla TaxID=7936 RepID=UPI0015A80211|nr:fibronectin type III domain-containing protein 5 isoform X1 [Anguilla anguilla]
MERFSLPAALVLVLTCLDLSLVSADSLTAPVNVTIKALKANSAVVTWDIPEGDPVIGFAITQQKKDVRMLRFIQEVNTTTRSCALWDLEEETDYIVHVQYLSMSGPSPPSEALHFRTPKEAEQLASKSKDEVKMEGVGQTTQLRAGELIIIVVVLIMWADTSRLFYTICCETDMHTTWMSSPCACLLKDENDFIYLFFLLCEYVPVGRHGSQMNFLYIINASQYFSPSEPLV